MKKFVSIICIIFWIFPSCESTVQEMYLDSFREAGFSEHFIREKEKEIEETEKEHVKEFEKIHGKEYEDLYVEKKEEIIIEKDEVLYEMGVVIKYIDSKTLPTKMKNELNLSIKTNIISKTKLNVYFQDEKNQKYIVELLVNNESKIKNIDEITLIFYKHGKFLREYTIKSVYKMNNENKEIPYKNMCDIVSRYITMILKNDLNI